MTLAEVWRTDASEVSEPKQVERSVKKIDTPDNQTEQVTAPEAVTPATETQHTEVQSAHSADCTCWRCTVCEWVYDPQQGEPYQGVEPGTPWAQVPDDFLCPECHLGKEVFVEK